MKIKGLLIFLGAVSLFAVGSCVWVYLSAQSAIQKSAQQQTALKQENSQLQEKLDSNQKETSHWRVKADEIAAALDRLSREHTALQRQHDSLSKEKESLAGQNKSLAAQLDKLNKLYAQTQEKTKVEGADSFLASLLQEKAEKEVEIENLKAKITAQENQLAEVNRHSRPYEENVSQLQKQIEVLEKNLADAVKVSEVLSGDLLKARKEKTTLEERLAKSEGQLGNISQERDKLSDQLSKMGQALQQKLAELNETKEVMEDAVASAKEAVSKNELTAIELSPIVVRAEEDLSSQQSSLPGPQALSPQQEDAHTKIPSPQRGEGKGEGELAGRIITVNAQHKFVVIDIGRENGVEKGMGFDVYRKGEKIGRIEVIETRQNIAACDIKEASGKRLAVNDIARR